MHLRFSHLLFILGFAFLPFSIAHAYIGGPPATFGMMCYWSTHITAVKVERVERDKGIVVYRKIRDIKGKWPVEVIRHAVGNVAAEKNYIMDWAEVGKTTVLFALESYKWSHVYVDRHWYALNTADWQWWNLSHGEPVVLRTYSGKPEKMAAAVDAILAGREAIVPCLADAPPNELWSLKAKVQRVRSSLKLLDYNPRRDFVAWGGDDFVSLAGMPGFTHYLELPRVDPDAQAICSIDRNSDGKPDLCLVGSNKLAFLINEGTSINQDFLAFPGIGGCRAAVWADYNGDGKPDLFLATPTGPKLFTNQGPTFKDDTALLPKETCYNLTAAAWMDYDGDGKPDLLLSNGFHGLRLYRNKGKSDAPPAIPGRPVVAATWFDDVSAKAGLGAEGLGGAIKGNTLTVADVNGDSRPDFLYGAGSGLLGLNTAQGFHEARDCGIAYKPGNVGPVFGDYDQDGRPDLFVPQTGGCKLFHNEGKGVFKEVIAQAGDLARSPGQAVCAGWGDFDNDGRLDLMVGCFRGPNRFYRNKGDGAFADETEKLGLHKKMFNTQALHLVDLNQDGMLDVVFNNEGQESAVLLGNPALGEARTPVTLQVGGAGGVIGSRVRILDKQGKFLTGSDIVAGEGRGSQHNAAARFALEPGAYRVEVRYSSGTVRARDISVAKAPLHGMIDDRTPKVDP